MQKNESEIAVEMDKIQALYEQKKYQDALVLNDNFISDNPTAWWGYRQKADILYKMDMKAESLDVRKKLDEIGSEEPLDYCNLAEFGLALGCNDEVIKWAQKGIDLCEKFKNYYYYQSLHFHKACAQINTEQYSQALESCENIEDGYRVYLYGTGMKSKEELVYSAEQGLKRKK